MTRLLLAVALLGAAGAEPTRVPTAIVVATARGEMTVPVSSERGHPVLPVRSLARLLPLSVEDSQQWLLVSFADQPFRFLLDAPLFVHEGRVVPLVGGEPWTHELSGITLESCAASLFEAASEKRRRPLICGTMTDGQKAGTIHPSNESSTVQCTKLSKLVILE